MPASEPRTSPPPRPAPVDGRQRVADTLTAVAVCLNTKQQTTDALYDLLDVQCRFRDKRAPHRAFFILSDRTVIALIAAAYADSEQTAALLDDLASASTDRKSVV